MHDSATLTLILSCLLGQAQEAADPVVEPVPTWHGDVQTLVRTHCADCHDGRGAAPFSLMDHDDVAPRRLFIKHVLNQGIMPPWLPSREGPALRDERHLSDEDRELIVRWIDAGAPVGVRSTSEDATDSEEANQVAADTVTASMRSPWEVPAEGGRRWFKAERDKRTFVMPLLNPEPLRIQRITYRSKSPIVLGATALSADTTGNARRMIDWDEEPGSYMMGDIGFVPAGSLGVVGPGGGSLEIPAGYHLAIPRGSELVSEVHFRPEGRPWTLNDDIELMQVPDEEPSRALVAVNVMQRKIELEPGERKSFTSDITIPDAVDLVALTPRASRRCISLEVIRHRANVPSESLLTIDDWNPHYRRTYVLESSIRLEANDRIEVTWRYDNSEGNPRNPVVPPEAVSLGARVGSANVLLMCAPVDPKGTEDLERFALKEMRRRQR